MKPNLKKTNKLQTHSFDVLIIFYNETCIIVFFLNEDCFRKYLGEMLSIFIFLNIYRDSNFKQSTMILTIIQYCSIYT